MSDHSQARSMSIDVFARVMADIPERQEHADAERIRALLASVVIQGSAPDEGIRSGLLRLPRIGASSVSEALAERLERAEEVPAEGDVLAVVRRDEREVLLSGSLVDSLTGLRPSERIGPVVTHGGTEAWFEIFGEKQRIEVREEGSTSPVFVLTQARLPRLTGAAGRSIDIEPGTVWIRGNRLSSEFSADQWVGIRVEGGSLQPEGTFSSSGNVVQVPSPFAGTLTLEPARDEGTPTPEGCSSAGTVVDPPDSLTLTFASGGVSTSGGGGTADVWGQQFAFGSPDGSWRFIERLFTAVLGYDVQPAQLDAGSIGDDLVQFDGTGDISEGGLGLPVVSAANPAILGEASVAASWGLQVKGLTARWYEPETRPHGIDGAWIDMSATAVTLVSMGMAPLTPPVTHTYELWTIRGTEDKRLPWRQTYDADPLIIYRCDVATGEYFMVQGSADVALDRPVMTDGRPIPTPTTRGGLLLHRVGGVTTASLGAETDVDDDSLQLALRNALVWTSVPSYVWVRGPLTAPGLIDAGMAQVLLGADGWAPTLPDPYVSNTYIDRPPEVRPTAESILTGLVTWTTPATVTVAFEGSLGPGIALGPHEPSPIEPRPARRSDNDPDVGLTQVEQGQLHLDHDEYEAWAAAQIQEQEYRGGRIEDSRQENRQSEAIIDRELVEVVGPVPNVLLLDVSTNQDLLGVAFGAGRRTTFPASVTDLTVIAPVEAMRVVALPQVQWEPVRTLDEDQDIMTMGWFPTPLASATDGGATFIGARFEKLMPVIPEGALQGTFEAFGDGRQVGIRTTFPFGLIAALRLDPHDTGNRRADLYGLTRPRFIDEDATGGIQVTAHAEGGRPDDGGESPSFQGAMRQLINGVDLLSGAPRGLSVLGDTQPNPGDVETIFNLDMAANPKVPVTRVDLAGYGGSNFSDWNNPFAAFAAAAKVQFEYMIARTALEVVKVNTVLHPWGIRVTRSVTIERRPGGGVIRRDSGWQAFTPGIFDYRYFDEGVGDIVVAPYRFDAGVFRGLFNVRNIRPAPGAVFSQDGDKLVPYYFDADVALDGVPGRTPAVGILGYLQIEPNGDPADPATLRALIDAQGPIGGPIETWLDFGGSGLPFRAQRIEVGVADDGGTPVFVATVRGAPKLPETGAWSVVRRPVANIPPNGGEAVPVVESRGVPVIRQYPVEYAPDRTVHQEPPLSGATGDYRFADASDLLVPSSPRNDYALLQSAATHAFLFPRPFVSPSATLRIQTGSRPALADVLARSTSKGAFPPAPNTIELAPGAHHFNVGPNGSLALSTPVTITGHPTPLRLAGTPGHGTILVYDTATLRLHLEANRWEAEFDGLRVWSDISGLERISGSELRVVGSTDQRPQIAELRTLVLQEIEDILQYIPIFGQRGVEGPIDLGATNAKHEIKVAVDLNYSVPPPTVVAAFPAGTGVVLKLIVRQSTGIDPATGGAKASATFAAVLEGKIPIASIGAAAVFIIIAGEISFSLTSVSGSVTSEKLNLMAFVGVGIEGKIGPFKAYAYLGVGFVLVYDAIADQTKYGGLVALEAGVGLVIIKVKIRAELKGLVYDDGGTSKCDYSGSVKIQADIFLIISISATYTVTETATI
jgi:hypothetical protein